MPRLAKRKLKVSSTHEAEQEDDCNGALKEITNNTQRMPDAPSPIKFGKRPRRDMQAILKRINEEHQKENAELKRKVNQKGDESGPEKEPEGGGEENAVVPPIRRARKKNKTVNFISSQPTEIIPISRSEPPAIQLETILNSERGNRQVTSAPFGLLPSAPKPKPFKPQAIEEVQFSFDEDELAMQSNMFSIHSLNVMVQVTKDTDSMTISELRSELAERKLSTAGTKEQLVARLEKGVQKEMTDTKRKKRTTRKLKKESKDLDDCAGMF